MSIVEVRKVSKTYHGFQVLKDISFEIEEGEIFGLLGPNGAGKSTLTRILTGLEQADSGLIILLDKEIRSSRNQIISKIAVVPQQEFFYPDFTVKENIEFFGKLYSIRGKSLSERTNYLIRWLNLSNFKDRKAEDLSGGYRRLLNVACSLVHDPKIVFLDEPTVALDPQIRKIFWKRIKELKEQGKTLVLTTHYMDEAQELCDRIAMIVKGEIYAIDDPYSLIQKFGGTRILNLKTEEEASKKQLENLEEFMQDCKVSAKKNFIFVSIGPQISLSKVSKLIDLLNESGLKVVSSQIKEPDLEDVFIHLTVEKISVKTTGAEKEEPKKEGS